LNYIRWEKFVRHLISFFGLVILFHLASAGLYAQDNYKIQVYGSETVAPKSTMVELHSNFTADGFKSLPGSPYTLDPPNQSRRTRDR